MTGLRFRVVYGLNRVHLVHRASDEDLQLGIPLVQIDGTDHTGDEIRPQAADPYVDRSAIDGGGAIEVSVIVRIDEGRIAWMRGSSRSVDHDLCVRDQSIER